MSAALGSLLAEQQCFRAAVLNNAMFLYLLQCGSCWAHAATSCLESAALIQLGKAYKDYKLQLSVQYLASPRRTVPEFCLCAWSG